MKQTLESIKAELKERSSYIKERYKAEIIGIFGSFVRNEQTASSDVDLLVRFLDGASLFDLVGLANFLEDTLLIKVDIVSERAIRDELREGIYREVIEI